jgi:hypothetical protein
MSDYEVGIDKYVPKKEGHVLKVKFPLNSNSGIRKVTRVSEGRLYVLFLLPLSLFFSPLANSSSFIIFIIIFFLSKK